MDNKIITSRENKKIKHLKKLLTDKDYRYFTNEYLIEGMNALDDADSIKEIFALKGVNVPEIYRNKTYTVDGKVFGYISDTENSQGIVAVASLSVLNSSQILENMRYVLLDRLQDPGNMGTIIRSVCAFNFRGIIVNRGCVDPFSPKSARASAGSIGKIDIIRIEDISELKDYNLISADLRGENISGFKWPEGFILCIGNEAKGVSDQIKAVSKNIVSIPISNSTESLNAAVACGIILFCAG